MSIKLLIITHGGGSPYHGPNMRWYYLARALKGEGVDVAIASSSFFHKYFRPPKINSLLSRESVNDVSFYWIKTNKYSGRMLQIVNQIMFSLKAFLLLPNIAKNKSYDIVIASSPHPLVVFAAKRCADFAGVPWIYEVRDLWPLLIQQLGGYSKNNPYIRLLSAAELYAVKNTDAIVSVKPGDMEYFIEKYSIKESFFNYIPNGFLPENHERKYRKISRPDSFIVGYVGALSAYYCLDNLIEAARQLKSYQSIKFRIVGGGNDMPRLQRLVSLYSLDNVTFSGKIDKKHVKRELDGFDICYVGLKKIDANLNGISCNKIFEYMYAGKPIIASYVTNHDPVKIAQCGVTVTSGSSIEIAQAIKFLVASPDTAKQMGENGRFYYEKNHNFTIIAKKYKELIFRLVTRRI